MTKLARKGEAFQHGGMSPSRLIPLLLLALPAFAQTTVTEEEATGLTPFQVGAVQSSSASFKDKLIKLTFLCRGAVVTDLPDGGKAGEVLDSTTTRQKMDVEVPKAGVDWFMGIPTTYGGGPAITAYARMTTDKFGTPVAKILGTEIKKDAGGTHVVWK